MLTENEMKMALLAWKVCCRNNTLHFLWRDGKLTCKKNPHDLYNRFMLFLVLIVLWCKLTMIGYTIKNNDINGAILQSIFLLITLGGTLLKINSFLYKDKLVKLTNELLCCNTVWGKQFLNMQYVKSKTRERAFSFALLAILGVGVSSWLMTLVTWKKSYLSYYLMRFNVEGKIFGITGLALLAYLILEAVIVIDAVCHLSVSVSILYLSCISTTFWLRQICIEWPTSKGDETEPFKDRIGRCITYYRGIYLINQEVNLAFGALYIPCLKFVVLLGLIVSFFALVRLRDELDGISIFLMPATFAATVILVVPISMVMSKMYELSRMFKIILAPMIRQFKVKEARIYFGSQLKSCSLVRCKVGNFYYMEAQAKLTMLDQVVNGLVFLLVNSRG